MRLDFGQIINKHVGFVVFLHLRSALVFIRLTWVWPNVHRCGEDLVTISLRGNWETRRRDLQKSSFCSVPRLEKPTFHGLVPTPEREEDATR